MSDTCTAVLDCSTAVANSICDTGSTDTCLCDPNYLSNNTACLTRNLGESCENDEQCVFGISANVTCDDSSQCQCEVGFISRGTSPDEICESRTITDTCTVDADCSVNIQNSECSSAQNLCACITGYDVNDDNSQCVAKTLGDSCSNDGDCTATITLSTCQGNVCVCPDGYIVINNSTCKLRQIQIDICENNHDCATAVENSICSTITTLCECVSGYIVNDDNSTCTLRVLSDTCTTNEDCNDAVTNSECNGTCACKLGYISVGQDTCRLRKCYHNMFIQAIFIRCQYTGIKLAKCHVSLNGDVT